MLPLSNGYGRPEDEEEDVNLEVGKHFFTNLLGSILLQNENPEAAREEEKDREHLIESRQGHLPERTL